MPERIMEDERIIEIETERLRTFRNHPFKVNDDVEMTQLVQSIKHYGILNPLIIRPLPEGVYEIISGHRRKYAAEQLGYRKVPVVIRVLKDEEAVISMVDSNLQRENISPGEKAFAIRMKYDAIKRKSGRRKKGQIDYQDKGKKTVEIIGEEFGDSPKQIQRYLKITELIIVDKELQRVTKESVKELDGKDIILVFPEESKLCKTVRVLKTPKTESSIRKVFLPRSVAEMLVAWKQDQDTVKEVLGDEYHDYNLVMATSTGMPTGGSVLRKKFKKLIEEKGLPNVVFHSLRHTSVTYKLKLNGGDVKAVQGDSGHAQVDMVTNVYSHIIDEDRKKNAQLFEEAFYGKKDLDPQLHVQEEERKVAVPEGIDPEVLAKVLANPETVALLASLAKGMGGQ